MKTNKLTTSLLIASMASFSSFSAYAQFQDQGLSAKQEITANRLLCASNYVAYQAPTTKLTPAPKGYAPFYVSTYARHGSRWLINKSQYTDVISTLETADKYGKLTAKGKQVLDSLKAFYPTTINRLGELTPLGERQHHGIAKRLTEHFPEVFSGNAKVEARSTVVIRCILSMEAECEELAAFNPKIKFHNDVSESFQYYLNPERPARIAKAISNSGNIIDEYRQKWVNPERFCTELFNDKQYVYNNVNAVKFMSQMFDVAGNMQSHDTKMSFLDLFTDDECYNLWRVKNISFFVRYANSPLNSNIAPFHEENLLRNFLTTCDTIVGNRNFNGATLRFGHETCLMPLACLMELGTCGKSFDNLETLDEQWRNYKIFPMGSNIQLVFYRPKKGNGDVLVKAMLNEHEVSLPAETSQYPYYKWADVEKYYKDKLNKYNGK